MKRFSSIWAVVALVLVILTGCTSSDVVTPSLRVRKNVMSLSAQEKKDFTDAMLKMKDTPSPYDPSVNYYDQFVKWHYEAFACSGHHHGYPAHMNPAFPPWHRVILHLFEKALRDVSGKDISIPYWDWTQDGSWDVVFSDDMMGGNGDPAQDYAVTTGPFRKGNYVVNITDAIDIDSIFADVDTDPNVVPYLVRNFRQLMGRPIALPTAAEVEGTLNIGTYDSAPWNSAVDTAISFRNSLEGWRGTLGDTCEDGIMEVIPGPNRRSTQHNIVHVYVGGVFQLPSGKVISGNMTQASSPNDPTFWIHHANIDRLWTAWMKRHGKVYQPVTGGPEGSNLNDVMAPWSFVADGKNTPAAVMETSVFGYEYESVP